MVRTYMGIGTTANSNCDPVLQRWLAILKPVSPYSPQHSSHLAWCQHSPNLEEWRGSTLGSSLPHLLEQLSLPFGLLFLNVSHSAGSPAPS